jgi:hypothetical protein
MGNGKQTQRSVDQFDAWFLEGAFTFLIRLVGKLTSCHII